VGGGTFGAEGDAEGVLILILVSFFTFDTGDEAGDPCNKDVRLSRTRLSLIVTYS